MKKNDMPQVGDKVMCKCMEPNEFGYYLQLLEYGNLIGLMQLSEISRKRIRSFSQIMNKNKIMLCEVLNVDPVNRFLDLSKKNITSSEISKYETSFISFKRIHAIVRRLSQLVFPNSDDKEEDNMLQVYSSFIWTHFNNMEGPELDQFFSQVYFGQKTLPEHEWSIHLLHIINNQYKTKPVHLMCVVECCCFGPNGIDDIKYVLNRVKKNFNIEINLIASPKYLLHLKSNNVEKDLIMLNEAAQSCVKWMLECQSGQSFIDKPPYASTKDTEASVTDLITSVMSDESDEDEESDSFDD